MELDYLASEFERASLGLQDGATLKAAEAFLTSLTEHPDALLICKSVLDRSQNPLALFHASVTIRRRIYRDFFVLPGADVVAFRDYLLGCCMKLPSLPAPTSSTLLQSVAVICKLGWLRDGEREVTNFLNAVVSLLPQAGRERFAILDFLLSLLGEFSANGAIQYGVSDELHLACKLQFQKAFLLRIFLSSCEVLQGWRVAQPPTPQPDLRLGVQVCRLLEGLLLWDFGREVRRADSNPTDPSDAGSPVEAYVGARHWRYGVPRVFPEGWKPYVTNLDFLDLLFELDGRFEANSEGRAALDQVLIMLSELDRDQFLSLEAKLHFTRQFILHLSNLIAKWHATHNRAEPHLLTIAQILGGVLGSGPFSELVQVAGFHELVEQAVQLTLACLRFGADDRDAASGEALEILLDIWAAVAGQVGDDERAFLASAFVEHARDLDGQNCASLQQLGRTLFDAYVSSCQDCATHEIYSGLKVASSYKDWVQYEDQMLSIGTLARVVPDHAVKRLCERFNVEFSEIRAQFELAERNPEAVTLQAAFERVRWLLIVTGYVLAYTGPGEEASIPVALNNLSNRHPDPDLDPVIQLPGLVFSMLEFLTFHPDDIKALSCSAELAETFFWFIERWAHTYLFPNKEGYVSVSNHLLRVFGTSSHETAGRVVLDMLLDKIRRNFQLWANCAPTAAQISRVLLHLVCRKESRLVLFNSPKFNELAKVLMGSLEHAGEEANRMVVQSILLIATGTSISETRQLLLSLVVNKLEEQLALTLGSLTRASCNDVGVLASMGNLLQLLRGFALANDGDNCLVLFRCYQNHLPPVLDLILAFRSRPEVWVEAFQFLSELTKNLDLFEFASADLAPLSRFVRRLHQTYAAAFPEILRAAEMRGASDPGLALPEALEGLCHLTQLETVLGEGEAYDCVLDLVFFGVAQLFPLLTVEGLRLPDLSVGFFTLVALVAETFPRPLFELGPEFLASVMGLLTFAQEKYPFASTYCRPLPLTNALCPMSPRSSPLMPCSFWRSKPLKPRPIVRCILPPNHLVMAEHLYLQLQALLRNLMFRRFDSGCLPQASDTLLVLLLVLPSRFQELKAAVVGRWAAPGGAERLLEQLDLLFEAAQSSGKLGGRGRPELDVRRFFDLFLAFLRRAHPGLLKAV